jgi:hypothetical protein
MVMERLRFVSRAHGPSVPVAFYTADNASVVEFISADGVLVDFVAELGWETE